MSTRNEILDQALQHGWKEETLFGEKDWFLELKKQVGTGRPHRLRVEFADTGRVDYALSWSPTAPAREQRITGGRMAILRYLKATK